VEREREYRTSTVINRESQRERVPSPIMMSAYIEYSFSFTHPRIPYMQKRKGKKEKKKKVPDELYLPDREGNGGEGGEQRIRLNNCRISSPYSSYRPIISSTEGVG